MREIIILTVVALAMLGFIYVTCLALKITTEMLKRYAAKLAADNRAEYERRKAANNE